MSTRADVTAAMGFFAGEDKSLIFTIRDADGGTMNITGWTIQFRFAASLGGTPLFTRPASLTTPSSGICTVLIPSTDTVDLDVPPDPDKSFWYDLRRTDVGSRAELAYGTVDLQSPYTDG
jgi:hypothetical protein